jgi:multidrug efflux pump subunit AcrB
MLDNAIIDALARRLLPMLMTALTRLIDAIARIISAEASYENRIAVGTVILFAMA